MFFNVLAVTIVLGITDNVSNWVASFSQHNPQIGLETIRILKICLLRLCSVKMLINVLSLVLGVTKWRWSDLSGGSTGDIFCMCPNCLAYCHLACWTQIAFL